MRQALALVAALVALVAVCSAAAGGPGPKNLPIKVSVPKAGHIGVHAFKLTVRLPPGTTISGGAPIAVHALNGAALAKGTLAAAAVVKTGLATWQVIVVVDARKASGSGASSLSEAIQVPPPYSASPVDDYEESGPCAEYEKVAHNLEHPIGQLAFLFWLASGPTDKGREIVLSGKDAC